MSCIIVSGKPKSYSVRVLITATMNNQADLDSLINLLKGAVAKFPASATGPINVITPTVDGAGKS